MTQDEAFEMVTALKQECDSHNEEMCLRCPIWSKEHNNCLVSVAFPDGDEEPKSDNVNQPAHYLKGGMECIDVIKAITSDLNGADAYYVGNIIKYVWRYNHKNGIEDLRKAKHYLEWLIESLEG